MSLSNREKSPDAFRTISEVAEKLELPQHVLRFWETKFIQIKPVKRRGGRRYYRPEDVQILERIRDLLHKEGYTIKGAQNFLRQNSQNLKTEASALNADSSVSQIAPEVPLEQPVLPVNSIDKDQLIAILLELKDIKNLTHTENI